MIVPILSRRDETIGRTLMLNQKSVQFEVIGWTCRPIRLTPNATLIGLKRAWLATLESAEGIPCNANHFFVDIETRMA
jgi:hypothetical protein